MNLRTSPEPDYHKDTLTSLIRKITGSLFKGKISLTVRANKLQPILYGKSGVVCS